MSEEDAGGVDSPAAPGSGSLPDDILLEILVRLPPEPSSLPRASAACKRWRRLLTDPKFLRLFCAHHRKPPLLGVFGKLGNKFVFSPVLDPPDCIPRERFSLGPCSRLSRRVLDVRHGRVLEVDLMATHLTVYDPITSEQRRIFIPREIVQGCINGAVLCTAGDPGHVHGGCHSNPFKVVLVCMYGQDNRSVALVYSSETVTWGNLISTDAPDAPSYLRGGGGDARNQPTLVGNAIYWLSNTDAILEFDLDEQSLTMIAGPPNTNDLRIDGRKIIRAEDGAIGFAILSYPHFHMWQRNASDHGAATWVPWKTIEIQSILGLSTQIEGLRGRLLGYDEDDECLFLYVVDTAYMVQLKSAQSKKLYTEHIIKFRFYPFNSFYPPGTAVAGGFNGAEMLP